jgi:hypothetical protein
MNLREAAQLALDALENVRHYDKENLYGLDDDITALRAALSDATCQESRQVEPVAWISYESLGRLKNGGNSRGAVPVHTIQSHTAKIPLYTAPREPLTEEKLVEAYKVTAANGTCTKFKKLLIGR